MLLTQQSIEEMKDGGKRARGLLPVVHRFAVIFPEVMGIAAHVEANNEPHVSDRLAAEIFQLVTEGSVTSDGAAGGALALFTPRAIAERAAALGVGYLYRGRARKILWWSSISFCRSIACTQPT